MALPATILAVRCGLPLSASGAVVTSSAREGSETAIGISIMPLVLLLSTTFIACQPTSPTTTIRPIRVLVQHLVVGYVLVDAPVWFSSTRSIDYNSKKDKVFSLMQTSILNDPNLDIKTPR